MTQEGFAEQLRQLIGEAADTGLSLPEMVEVLEDQAEAMPIAYHE